MDKEQSKEIISYVVEKTEPRWEEYGETWDDIDEIFIRRGYEQGGFEFFKFYPLLEEGRIFSIDKLGSILDKFNGSKSYKRNYAGGFDKEFYLDIKIFYLLSASSFTNFPGNPLFN